MRSKFSTKTGLLFLLTIVPVLVLLFLYLFGKNQYDLDQYPGSHAFLSEVDTKEGGILLLPTFSGLSEWEKKSYKAQLSRLSRIFGSMPSIPHLVAYGQDTASLKPFFPTIHVINLPDEFSQVYLSDTVLPITTAKGEAIKKLPKMPRAYFFDNNMRLRGVYNITESAYLDTLILEYKIYTNP